MAVSEYSTSLEEYMAKNDATTTKKDPKVLLMPGPSAAGRDFLLERILAQPDVVAQKVGVESIRMAVAQKLTDRPSRTTELTKKTVSEEEFDQALQQGDVFGHYVLESNGKNYGYHKDAFQVDDADLLIADASIYQVPDLKKRLNGRSYVAAMIPPRQYRETNLRARGSETEEEIQKRLNLGDAHVALAILMAKDGSIKLEEYIHPGLADAITLLMERSKEGRDTSILAEGIKSFTGSPTVPSLIEKVASDKNKYVDQLVPLSEEHRISSDQDVTQTPFFSLGVQAVENALKGSEPADF